MFYNTLKKVVTTEVYNRRFWHTLFIYNIQINKKAYLQTLKFLPIPPNISMTTFILKNNHVKKTYIQTLNTTMTSFISKIKKDTYKPKHHYNPFYSNNFVKVTILIKSIHTNSKHYRNTFHTKKIIKLKSIFTNLKIPGKVFLLIPFFKY